MIYCAVEAGVLVMVVMMCEEWEAAATDSNCQATASSGVGVKESKTLAVRVCLETCRDELNDAGYYRGQGLFIIMV
jgi:hypothetical protein